MTTPSVELRPLIKLRAIASGRYSSWLIASSTRRRVSSATYGWSLSTRETVWIDTPAWDATWRMVAFFPEVIRSHFPLTRVVLNSAHVPSTIRARISVNVHRSEEHTSELQSRSD